MNFRCDQCEKESPTLYFDRDTRNWYCRKCTSYFKKDTNDVKIVERALNRTTAPSRPI